MTNLKTETVTKLTKTVGNCCWKAQNSNCDKTENATKLTILSVIYLKKITQNVTKLKTIQNLKTQIVI